MFETEKYILVSGRFTTICAWTAYVTRFPGFFMCRRRVDCVVMTCCLKYIENMPRNVFYYFFYYHRCRERLCTNVSRFFMYKERCNVAAVLPCKGAVPRKVETLWSERRKRNVGRFCGGKRAHHLSFHCLKKRISIQIICLSGDDCSQISLTEFCG